MSLDRSIFDQDLPDIRESADAKKARRFKYVKARDEGGEYYMPATAAIVLGDEAVGVIIRVLRHEMKMVLQDELDRRFGPDKPVVRLDEKAESV